jgi:hypothetical protein
MEKEFKQPAARPDAASLSDRRSFISALAATATVALVPCRGRNVKPVGAQAAAVDNAKLIDVHHYIILPSWLSENRDQIASVAGARIYPAYLSWTPEQTAMDMQNVVKRKTFLCRTNKESQPIVQALA